MDKVQKIREEVARIQLYTQSEVLKQVLDYIDKVQEEPVKIKKGCKYRSICNVTNNDTGNISFVAGKIYLAPEDDTLVSEENGWLCDTSEDASNFELVEEPVSEDLEEAANFYANTHTEWFDADNNPHVSPAFKAGAQWQEEQMMAKAIDGTARPDDNEIWCNLTSNNLEDGDKIKVIVIKED